MAEEESSSALQGDRGIPLGNSLSPNVVQGKARRRLHVFVDQGVLEPIPVTTTTTTITTPIITNVDAPVAGTEYSYSFQDGSQRFLIQPRTGARLQVAFVAGQSGTQFMSYGPGVTYMEENVILTGVTVYFQLNKPGQTVEILEWK